MPDNNWDIEKSRKIYGIGDGFREYHFLDINDKGQLCLKLNDKTISFNNILQELLEKLDKEGNEYDQPPSVTLRIPQLIEYQIKKLKGYFSEFIDKKNYKGKFIPIYPIKVNQQAYTINAVLEYGGAGYGLEAGTKSELAIILMMLKNHDRKGPIVCNGVKDMIYLELISQKLAEGYDILVSVESLRETEMLVQTVKDPSLTKIALRIKPYFPVSGHWGKSAERDSKFGLSIGELNKVLTFLKDHGYENQVTAIHAHIGSQITSLNDFKVFAMYMAKIYVKIREMGYSNLSCINFGGGLSIDYEGSMTTDNDDWFSSYANYLISGTLDVVGDHPHPDIMIEAGRAITAHSSLVLTQILEIRDIYPSGELQDEVKEIFQQWEEKIDDIKNFEDFKTIWSDFRVLNASNIAASHEIGKFHDEELLTGMILTKIRKFLADNYTKLLLNNYIDDPDINTVLTRAERIAICNFSVFNSACDYVLVDQYFPIFPIESLHLRPETIIRIVDITCDSDGEISSFITKISDEECFTEDGFPVTLGQRKINLSGIPVPAVNELNESYFLIALLGAYQDVIEFDHNLIGDLPDAEIFYNDDSWKINWIAGPESLEQIIGKVGHKISSEFATLGKSSYVYDSWNRQKQRKK
ncbi:MAG: hypothetical protein ACTSP4_08620 [Candidatus Hodarchaeales archaeon]